MASLEYRDFPARKSVYYWLTAPSFTYLILVVLRLAQRNLFGGGLDEVAMLGVASGVAALTLLLGGVVVDFVRRTWILMPIAALVPIALGMTERVLGYPNDYSPELEWAIAISGLCGLAFLMMCWTVQVNETVVIRYRARVVGPFLLLTLIQLTIYGYLGFDIALSDILNVALPAPLDTPLPLAVAAVTVVVQFAFRPWRWQHHALAVGGRVTTYFTPMAILLAAHILWYFATQSKIAAITREFLGHDFVSLGVESGLTEYEPLLLAVGVVFASGIADLRGRKTAFSLAILFVGLLSIFGSSFYGYQLIGEGTVHAWVYAAPLLILERFIEGFLLGLCSFLIWSEIGSPKTRARRLGMVWLFFLGYMALYWAVALGAFGWGVPTLVTAYGNEFAILLSLIALYFGGHTEELVGREIEMEDLSLDFDEKMVKKTVEAYVGNEDFDSIKTQLDVIGTTEELSDSDMSDILGQDAQKATALRKIPGVGVKMEEKLIDAGYESVAQLAGETPARLSTKIKGLSPNQAEKIIIAARESIKELSKSKEKKQDK